MSSSTQHEGMSVKFYKIEIILESSCTMSLKLHDGYFRSLKSGLYIDGNFFDAIYLIHGFLH